MQGTCADIDLPLKSSSKTPRSTLLLGCSRPDCSLHLSLQTSVPFLSSPTLPQPPNRVLLPISKHLFDSVISHVPELHFPFLCLTRSASALSRHYASRHVPAWMIRFEVSCEVLRTRGATYVSFFTRSVTQVKNHTYEALRISLLEKCACAPRFV